MHVARHHAHVLHAGAARGVHHPLQHGLEQHLGQHLGAVGTHPLAVPGGQNNRTALLRHKSLSSPLFSKNRRGPRLCFFYVLLSQYLLPFAREIPGFSYKSFTKIRAGIFHKAWAGLHKIFMWFSVKIFWNLSRNFAIIQVEQ